LIHRHKPPILAADLDRIVGTAGNPLYGGAPLVFRIGTTRNPRDSEYSVIGLDHWDCTP
jgi:hypothetical protein